MIILISVLLGTILLRLAIIDLRSFRLPNIYTLPLIFSGITLNWALAQDVPHGAIWGAFIGYVAFWAIGTFFYQHYAVEGLGLGDAKLFAAAGAWVTLANLPYVLLFAACGALFFTILKGEKRGKKIAFGPWLSIAFWLVWTAGVLL